MITVSKKTWKIGTCGNNGKGNGAEKRKWKETSSQKKEKPKRRCRHRFRDSFGDTDSENLR